MREIKRPELPLPAHPGFAGYRNPLYSRGTLEAYGLAMQRYGMLLAAEICSKKPGQADSPSFNDDFNSACY
jgi:hypothetical protein